MGWRVKRINFNKQMETDFEHMIALISSKKYKRILTGLITLIIGLVVFETTYISVHKESDVD